MSVFILSSQLLSFEMWHVMMRLMKYVTVTQHEHLLPLSSDVENFVFNPTSVMLQYKTSP